MKKVLYPALVAFALLGAANSWGAPFVVLGAKGKAVATGVGVVGVLAACGLVAENHGGDHESTSTTTTTRTK